MKKKVFIAIIAVILVMAGVRAADPDDRYRAEKATEPVIEISEPEVVLGFLDELEYSAEQIEAMRTVLTNVGITEITELEIGAVSYGMQTVKGIAFTTGELSTPQEVQVRFNIENGVIYLVSIYCPSYGSGNQTTYLSGLSDRRADLYYDGYLKKIDWVNKAVVDYGN